MSTPEAGSGPALWTVIVKVTVSPKSGVGSETIFSRLRSASAISTVASSSAGPLSVLSAVPTLTMSAPESTSDCVIVYVAV